MNFKHSHYNSFCSDFRQEVIKGSEEDETTYEDKFTELFMDALEEADETENTIVSYHKKTGIKINAYGINDLGTILDLFVSEYTGQVPPLSIPKSEIESIFRRAENFFEKCLDGYYRDLEEAQPVYDLSDRIYRFSSELKRIRFFLLTDKFSKLEEIKDKERGDFIYSYQVWDINRYYKLISSGKNRETITIKLKEDFDSPLPCLNECNENPVYSSYLSVIPGKTLVELYDEYGPRLLERNVRSFLQVKGKVNKGIRETVLNEPEMFLAFNNGLSTTAEEVTTEIIEGRTYITQIRDFQIVNGAQTTATLHDTYIKNKEFVNLDYVVVPMKLTVLKDHSEINELVSKISEYSNTQNKIDMADFSSNHPFHVKMEELSERVRAPSKVGIQLESYWFYERVRGQYINKRNRESTLSKKKLFDKIYPKQQKFEKTDLAIFEHTWQMRPYDVSLGKQKNYKLFMSELESDNGFKPDEKYFMDVVAKAILYKETYSIVRKELEGGYRPNIVAYSIAYLNYKTDNKINLERIWREQDICNELRNVLSLLVKRIQKFILTVPEGRNVTEFCKKQECWDLLCQQPIELPENIRATFSMPRTNDYLASKGGKTAESVRTVSSGQLSKISPEDWERMAVWGLETGYLDAKQRYIAKKIYTNKKSGRYISADQMLDGNYVYTTAKSMGFQLSQKSEPNQVNLDTNIEYNIDSEYITTESKSISSDIGSGISDEIITIELIAILKRHGGKCRLLKIFDELENKWENKLTSFDLGPDESGYPRWKVRVSGMKNVLIENQILKKYSNIEIWVLNPYYENDEVSNLTESRLEPETGLIRNKFGKILNTGISDERIEEGIIDVLAQHNGVAKLSDLLSDLENIWNGMFNNIDLEKTISGSVRWRARVAGKKKELINKGILDQKGHSGIWELSKNTLKNALQENDEDSSLDLYQNFSLMQKNESITEKTLNNLPDIQKAIIHILGDQGGADEMKHIQYEIIKLSKLSDPKYPKIPKESNKIRSEMISGRKALVKKGLLEKKTIGGRWKLSLNAMNLIKTVKESNS